nr:hypothalamic peptide [Euphlyctis]
GVPAQGDKPL